MDEVETVWEELAEAKAKIVLLERQDKIGTALLIEVVNEREKHKERIADLEKRLHTYTCAFCGMEVTVKEMTREQIVLMLSEHMVRCVKHPISVLEGEIQKTRKVAAELFILVEHYAPVLSEGHVCGPESNCDCECAEVAEVQRVLSDARRILGLK